MAGRARLAGKEAGMRPPLGLAAAIIGSAVLLPGCAQRQQGPARVAHTPPGGTAVAAACRDGRPATAGRTLRVSVDDNRQSFCVNRGTTVLVYLKGSQGHKWALIQASSSALQSIANAHLQLAAGVTGASFAAAHPGTAIITSVRPVCGSQPPQADTSRVGAVQCEAILTFRVTVTVH